MIVDKVIAVIILALFCFVLGAIYQALRDTKNTIKRIERIKEELRDTRNTIERIEEISDRFKQEKKEGSE